MRDARFAGLTWDHPRGYRALEAAAARHAPFLQWSRQPLEGFESHPIADLAARYDLIVLDHPHIGDAIAANCLQPIESWLSPAEMQALASSTIGRTLESYRWGGRTYALPLDVAAQVMARDPAIVAEPAHSWDDVARLAERIPVALSLAGPHAILTLFSIALALGSEPGGEDLIEEHAGGQALRLMARLAGKAPAGSERLNPIGLLEAVAAGSGIALVPLVFGYVNYAVPAPGRRAIAFSDAPHMAPGGRRGSVLGGTGIGVSRRAAPSLQLIAHLRWLMSEAAQCGFIPAHDGQPAARRAWQDAAVNDSWGGFYRATAATVEQAWVRPRFPGYVAFQDEASAIVRQACLDGRPPADTLARLRRLWRRAKNTSCVHANPEIP